jgi:hypothetical protein
MRNIFKCRILQAKKSLVKFMNSKILQKSDNFGHRFGAVTDFGFDRARKLAESL